MKIDLEKYNQKVSQWTKEVTDKIKATGEVMGIEHRENSPSPKASLPKLRGGTKKADGAIDTISFKFPRILIYTHQGAGKGRGGNKGSKWIDKYGATKETNPKSFGKMGTNGRRAKPFINTAIDRNIDQLGDIVAEELSSAIINKMFIK